MRGKTIVITGATSGIGEVAAIRLAEQGARIVFTARDRTRADVTMEKLRRANGTCEHAVHLGDLSLLADMKRVAAEIWREPRIDVLINNAGAVFNARVETRDGLERTYRWFVDQFGVEAARYRTTTMSARQPWPRT